MEADLPRGSSRKMRKNIVLFFAYFSVSTLWYCKVERVGVSHMATSLILGVILSAYEYFTFPFANSLYSTLRMDVLFLCTGTFSNKFLSKYRTDYTLSSRRSKIIANHTLICPCCRIVMQDKWAELEHFQSGWFWVLESCRLVRSRVSLTSSWFISRLFTFFVFPLLHFSSIFVLVCGPWVAPTHQHSFFCVSHHVHSRTRSCSA